LVIGLGLALPLLEQSVSYGGGSDGALHKITWPTKNPVWSLYWVAPPDSTSPHGYGSGLEVRHVYYKGKCVLCQAHVPVVNAHIYQGNMSYRHWTNEYAPFQFNPADPSKNPVTALDHPGGADEGTFRGVAVQSKSDRLILTTEMRAGWYRFVQTWTFYPDGVIEPRWACTASNENPYMSNRPQ